MSEENMNKLFEVNPMTWFWIVILVGALIVLFVVWSSLQNNTDDSRRYYDYKLDNSSATYCQNTLYLKEDSGNPSNYSCSWIEFMIKKGVYPDDSQEIYFCKECPECNERWQQTVTLSKESIIKKFKQYYVSVCGGKI